MSARKVIISSAVTGSVHTPSMSPHLPVTAEEIAEAAIGAAEAGAAIVHLHARDSKDGRPDQSPERFKPFLQNYQAARELQTMIRIAVSPRAYRAIKTTLPEGSVVYPPERDRRGRYLLMLDEKAVNNLNVQRRIGESLSDVIIRLARKGMLPA
jgi:hypothetical protein